MRTCRAASGTFGLAAVLLLAFAGGTQAATHYVDVNSTNAMPPYTNWATAATNIQDAVDAAAAGDEIVVTNGTYAPVTVLKPIAVRSVNGPQFTTISGGGPCVYLTNNASLYGFTLTNGYSRSGGGAVGGTLNNCTLAGNWSDSGGGASYATLNNCTLTGNSAREYGGGAYGCTLNNCTLTGNSAYHGGGAESCALDGCTLSGNSAGDGGGAYSCTLNNCTLTGNSGGGASGCTLTNCIAYFNSGANYDSSCSLNYSCTTPLPASGVGNISSDPQLASASHLSAFSPCIGKGYHPAVNGADIDGEPWANPPSIGCDEYHAGAVTGPLSVAITSFTNVAVGYPVDLTALIEGRTDLSIWDFGDGALEINQPYTAHSWAAPGDYLVSLWAFNDSYPGGISATVNIRAVVQPVHYVAAASANPVAPYASWVTAATNIQQAIAAATVPGALVLVTNGTYAPVTVLKPIAMRSVNGPQSTTINGGRSVPCVYLTNNASLSGFTLMNGYADGIFRGGGGGAYGGTLNNCTLTGNSAWDVGGGAYGCILNNCTLTGNSASDGGGAYSCTLNNCTLTGNSAYYIGGGGACYCTLNNCALASNSVVATFGEGDAYGGGADYSTLNNCTLTGNSVRGAGGYAGYPTDYYYHNYGGGASRSTLFNCTLVGNSSADYGGGAYSCTLNNCPLTGNSAGYGGGALGATLNNCTLSGNSATYAGGGAYGGTLNNCTLEGNSVSGNAASGEGTIVLGGGAAYSTLNNCTLIGNWANGTGGGDNFEVHLSGGGAAYSTLNNCTLIGNGATATVTYVNGYGIFVGISGGGAYGCTLHNCTLFQNVLRFRFNGGAWYGYGTVIMDGGGASSCTLNNCALRGNFRGAYGSTLSNCTLTENGYYGASSSTLNNCTLTGNSYGADDCTLNNCIVYFNSGGNYGPSNTLNYCCTTPLPASGVGNISSDPQLASAWRLSAASPCRGAGNAAYASGTDIDGEAWLNPPSIGCDEYHAGAVTGPLSVGITASYTNVLMGFTVQLTALIDGRTTASSWDFGDGITVTNQPYTSHAWAALGDYAVILRAYNESQPGGISATVTVHVVNGVHYVAASSTNPVAPYASWATAATNIQDAIAAAEPGGPVVVVVTNGNYAPIAASGPLTVRSVNGPQFTTINGGGANQCAYLGSDASLSGFTLTNGFEFNGGGAYGGTLTNCVLTGNSAKPTYGWGGGAFASTLNNCALTGNFGTYGGGAASCILNNCTLTGNSALYSGGGTYGCTLNNCIVYFNTSTNGANFGTYSTLNYCCTTPQPTNGFGNITNAPLFVDTNGWANLRLQSNSPCINAGNNAFAPAAPDLDGNPRIKGGTVDIGAYEFQSPVSQISYAWLQQYGLPINSSTDTADPDGDGVDNYHEWLAGTNPTNSLSSPAQLTITPSGVPPGGVILTWSTNAVGFTLQSTTNLGPTAAWVTNSPAPVVVNGMNTVTNPLTGGQKFYRLVH